MNLLELDDLLKKLRHYTVMKYSDDKIDIEFFPPPPPALPPEINSEELMPPDLRADDTMTYDKELNWSAGPDTDPHPLPLTGEDAK